MRTSPTARQPPIQKVLYRIRWDPVFRQGRFELGYWDRVQRQIVRVSLTQVRTDAADHFALRVLDAKRFNIEAPFTGSLPSGATARSSESDGPTAGHERARVDNTLRLAHLYA